MTKQKDPAAVALGKKGGKARAAALDPATRRAIATKASRAAAKVRTAKAKQSRKDGAR